MPASNGNSDDASESSVLERRYDEQTAASVAVVETVAAAEGVDPTAIEDEYGATLLDSVDPKALDTLVGDGDGGGTVAVEFVFLEYRIRVDDAGRIRIFDDDR
ncbi:HalOD1 output domain-containing protein [Natronococcus sp.]|uniref:HalOD1 output domain-containing protein n=1 Tax=Natronococcus sp. TaxID=35747 RepID=UPI0025E26CB9|nr:HalOD1 output domain-containing protein [Natronococcus sp.]